MGQFGIGQPVLRTEDPRLLTGHGRYTDDIDISGQAYGHVLRSPHAHATLGTIDATAARAAPGVLAVYTEADLAADGVGNLPCMVPLRGKDGKLLVKPPRPALARGRVRHVGDPVAFVVAETVSRARDAAELIEVDYDALPSITDTAGAVSPDAAQIWDEAPGNLSFDWEKGDAEAVAAALAKAAHVVSLDLVNNRLIPSPIEERAAIGHYTVGDDRYTLYTSTQGSHGLRRHLVPHVFDIPESRMRVVTPDVGGGFGAKIFIYPEQVLVLWAARKLGRAVKWASGRDEGFVTDLHGRDQVSHAEAALDKDGRILAIKVSTIANMGAYLSVFSPFIATMAGVNMLVGSYTIPAAYVEVRGVFTNTTPTDAYRGAGRPEANFVIERVMDTAAREIGLDPDEIRRRNFIPPGAMPYTTAMGAVYDSGEFQKNMDDAMATGDWRGFPERKAAARKDGKFRGIGLATYIESCAGGPEERAEVRLDPSGAATILIGTQSNGQGHETAYAQILADRLDIPPDKVRVLQGDTDIVAHGRGTGGSRSISVGGGALLVAADRIIEKGKRVAARALEAADADIEFAEGTFTIAGTDRAMSLAEVVRASYAGSAPPGEDMGLDASGFHTPANHTFPNGCHVVEVEIDGQTGVVRIVRYTVVDDFGTIINPLMLAGQVHGGIAQGVGQALHENCVYDPESGQLLSGSFMDYGLPRADDFPDFNFATNVVPCTTNPLGMKGAGEAGCIGAPPAVINAIVDALAELGVRHVDMPATPEKIWRLLNASADAGA